MRPVEQVELAVGGIPGDRHFAPESARQLLLLEAETVDALGLQAGQVRENLTVGGLPLMGLLAGTRIRLGQAELEITKVCEPCSVMDTIRPGLQQELQGRRGMLARVVVAGVVRRGDRAAVVEAAEAPA